MTIFVCKENDLWHSSLLIVCLFVIGKIDELCVFWSNLLSFSVCNTGEMAIPHYTGKMTDWIMNEDEPDAFNHAITVMTLMTIMR